MTQETQEGPNAKCRDAFQDKVVGKKITTVYYDKDSGMPVMILDDGAAIFVQRDDEGNGPGVPVHVSGSPGNQTETGMWEVRRY